MRKENTNIGFMQGRLSPPVLGRIQGFPHENWKTEFPTAFSAKIGIMEWTIDSIDFNANPLMNDEGQSEIIKLSQKYKVKIPSVTCDYFMENPPWKPSSVDIESDLLRIFSGMNSIGSKILVIPLVDNSSISNQANFEPNFFLKFQNLLRTNCIRIAFEVDLNPELSFDFISLFPKDCYGINYDIGNSASLGFDVSEEIKSYGSRVINVHVKDRILGGSTVRLGSGNADFRKVIHCLRSVNYESNYIMQTARSPEGLDLEEINQNISFFEKYLINET